MTEHYGGLATSDAALRGCSAPLLLGKQVWSLPGCLLTPPALLFPGDLHSQALRKTSPHLSPWGTVAAWGSEMTRKENSPKQLWAFGIAFGKTQHARWDTTTPCCLHCRVCCSCKGHIFAMKITASVIAYSHLALNV